MAQKSSSKSITSESTLDDPDLAETLSEDMGIAFHWVAKNFGQSIGEQNIERVQKFAQLEPQRTFYIVVHGLTGKQVNELNLQFNCYSNVKVIRFNSLKLEQHDLSLLGYTDIENNRAMRLAQYWNDMYSEKVKRRMDLSNEIDLMKYHLAIHSDQIVGVGNLLAVFDFDTLPVEGKKIGKVKIIKGGVLLAYLPNDVDGLARLDLPILAVSKEGNAILQAFQETLHEDATREPFLKESHMANMLIFTIKNGNVSNLLEHIGVSSSSPNRREMSQKIRKDNQLFAFNRNENVIITSDRSWHYSNYTKANNTSCKTDTVKQSTSNPTNIPKISTPTPPQRITSSAAPLQQTPVSNETNNNFQQKKQINQPPIVGNPKRNSPQKQPLGISARGWTIGLALLFDAVGATLVAIGIIPEIFIGVIATAVLLGIAGAALGGIVGYLTDITVNKCCNSEAVMKAA